MGTQVKLYSDLDFKSENVYKFLTVFINMVTNFFFNFLCLGYLSVKIFIYTVHLKYNELV